MARHSAMISVKTLWQSVKWRRRYSPVFFLFLQVTHFQPGKWSLRWAVTSVHAAHFYRTRVRWSNSANNSQNGWIVFEKIYYISFHSIWRRWKRKQNCGKRDKLVLSPQTGLRIRWHFATVSNVLRDPLTQPFKKRKGKRKIRYLAVKQNGWYLLSQTIKKPTICKFHYNAYYRATARTRWYSRNKNIFDHLTLSIQLPSLPHRKPKIEFTTSKNEKLIFFFVSSLID